MKYIGLDLGSRTLGVAISDELGILARKYDTLRFREDDYDKAISYTLEICEKEKVKNIVLGLPRHMNGDQGIRANISVDFKNKIESLSDIKALENWNVSNGKYFLYMFSSCKSLSDIKPLENWNVSNDKNISHIFAFSSSLSDLRPLEKWNISQEELENILE